MKINKEIAKRRRSLGFSICTPWWILHFEGLTYDGISICHIMGSHDRIMDLQRIFMPKIHNYLVHYDKQGSLVSKTIRSFFGEPNHYDVHGMCIGYSRKQSAFLTNHYDRAGKLVGHSCHYLGILLIHHRLK